MQLQFTKEIIHPDNPKYQGFLEDDRLYEVFNDEKKIGEFHCSGNSADFEFSGLKYSININKRFWKSSEYKIFDSSNLQVGEYFIPVNGAFNNLGSLLLNNSLYSFENLDNPKQFNILNPATWKNVNNKQYALKISDTQNEAIYKLAIHTKVFSEFASAEFSTASGTIECADDNLLLAFAGLFLVERFFNDLDDTSN